VPLIVCDGQGDIASKRAAQEKEEIYLMKYIAGRKAWCPTEEWLTSG